MIYLFSIGKSDMIIENPADLDLPADYMMTYDVYFWSASVVIGLIGSILFLIRHNKSEIEVQKGLFMGMSIFSLFFSLMRVSYILSIRINAPVYDIFTLLGYIFGLGGFGGFILGIEKYVVKKTKYLLSTFSFFVVFLGILGLFSMLDRPFIMSLVYTSALIDSFLMIVIYVGLVIKTTGAIRRRTILSLLGILCLIVSTALDSQYILALWGDLYIAPILAIIGLSFVIIIQRYN